MVRQVCLADVNEINGLKRKSSHQLTQVASQLNMEHILWALVSAGGSLQAENNVKLTPIDFVERIHSSEMAEVLQPKQPDGRGAPCMIPSMEEWLSAWEKWRKEVWCVKMNLPDDYKKQEITCNATPEGLRCTSPFSKQ